MKLAKPVWWTWDHSTNWTINAPGKQNMGASNFYGKSPEQFVTDYTKAIRFAAEHGIDAIFIAGLLRDCHGGIDAARKIAQVGRDAGVRICGIVGLLAYGGIYYEGQSEWSLDRFLKQNPECIAVDREGRPMIKSFGNAMPKRIRHACGSNEKVRDFVLRSVEWLFKAIPELGGLQFETGDTGVCQCANCRKRYSSDAKIISYDDMALLYPKVTEIILAAQPGAWAVCETYAHFLPRRMRAEPNFACGLFPNAVGWAKTGTRRNGKRANACPRRWRTTGTSCAHISERSGPAAHGIGSPSKKSGGCAVCRQHRTCIAFLYSVKARAFTPTLNSTILREVFSRRGRMPASRRSSTKFSVRG
jgi:hypothetical protein